MALVILHPTAYISARYVPSRPGGTNKILVHFCMAGHCMPTATYYPCPCLCAVAWQALVRKNITHNHAWNFPIGRRRRARDGLHDPGTARQRRGLDDFVLLFSQFPRDP